MGDAKSQIEGLIRAVLGRKASRQVVRDLARRLSSQQNRRLPATGETLAVAVASPKTAALCFDRVWAFGNIVPDDIGFFGQTHDEVHAATSGVLATLLTEAGEYELADVALEGLNSLWVRLDGQEASWVDWLSLTVANAIRREYQLPVVSTFESRPARDAVYSAGQYEVVITLLENVAVVNEDSVTWEQVREFRRDNAARSALRRLRHWLDADMVGKPKTFIHDEVAVRLEKYEAALNRHGIETSLGALAATLDGTFLVGAAATVAATTKVSTPTLGLIAGAGLFVGRVAVHVAERLVGFEKIKAGANSEIAFVSEVKRRLSS